LADLMGQRDEYLDWHRENLKTRTSGSKENK
jgi:hypothetical protein